MTRAAEREWPNVFTPATLADWWGCSKTTIIRMIKRGDLPTLDFPHTRVSADVVRAIEDGVQQIAAGNIYVVEGAGMIKIGFSIDPIYRLRTIAATSPVPIETICVQLGSPSTERALHERFREYRAHGEWFRKEGHLAAWIEAGCPI